MLPTAYLMHLLVPENGGEDVTIGRKIFSIQENVTDCLPNAYVGTRERR